MAQIEKIKKLIGSKSEDDLKLGISLMYEHFHRNTAHISAFLEGMNELPEGVEVYIGEINIVFWDCPGWNPSIYDGRISPLGNKRVIRL